MNFIENQKIELKREYVSDIRKEVVAFANSDGGKVLIGVDDNANVCGVKNPDSVMLQLSNSLKDAIAPDIMPFVEIISRKVDEKMIVELTVSPGINRPSLYSQVFFPLK